MINNIKSHANNKKKKNNNQTITNHNKERLKCCVLYGFEKHISRVHNATSSSSHDNKLLLRNSNNITNFPENNITSPNDFINGFMKYVAPQFKIGIQEYSHEFLRLLINAMQRSSSSSANATNETDIACNMDKDKDDNKNTCPYYLFRDMIESTVTC